MNCPIDGETLMMSERQGVEIDYCPRCRGVWLDRGELDKLVAAVDRDDDDRYQRGDRRDRDDDRYDRRDRDDDRYDRDRDDRPSIGGIGGFGGDSRKRKKKSFLSDMFEMGD